MNECTKIYRASHACANGPFVLKPVGNFLRHLNQFLFSCHIGSHAQIGEGCFFQHNGLGVVISEKAIIGDNCEFFQHVTVGDRAGGVPVIEDGVIVGANAVILGAITVHKGAKIGAGAVVIHDVPEGATVVGVPARIVS